MSSFLGESIDKGVVDQLEVRQKVISRDTEYIQYYFKYKSVNNAWIRLTSGVDTLDANGKFTPNLAKNFILSGGVLKWDGKRFVRNENFTPTGDSGRYNVDETFGVRPEPGITSFSIQHKNSFGTIREAAIEFVVWTKEDFDKADKLFFRAGFTVVCEWGNAGYVSNTNEFVDTTSTNNYDKIFGYEKEGLSKVESNLETNKETSSFNYDAFIGLVTNFSWSLRPDGGYNCSVRVVSKGAIIESLELDTGEDSSTNLALQQIDEKFYSIKAPDPENEDDEPEINSSTEIELKQRRSLLDFFCISVEDIPLGESSFAGQTITYSNFNSKFYSLDTSNRKRRDSGTKKTFRGRTQNPLVNILKDEGIEDKEFLVTGFDGGSTQDKDTGNFRYISLRTFLALVNASFLSTDDKVFPKFSIDYNDYKEYATFENHFSYDPSLVLLPKTPTQPELQKPIKEVQTRIAIENTFRSVFRFPPKVFEADEVIAFLQVVINNTSENIERHSSKITKKETEEEKLNNILNIHISTKLIRNSLDASLSPNEVESTTLLSFMKSILKQINQNLGGINELDVHYDDSTNLFSIVDRDQASRTLVSKNVETINLSGLSSIVSSVELQTKISSELTSQIAISANASNSNSLSGNANLSFFNKGVLDRFKQVEAPQRTEEETDAALDQAFSDLIEKRNKEEERLKTFYNNLFNAYMTFNNQKNDFTFKGKYDKSLFDKIRGEALSRTKKAYLGGLTTAPSGFIPFTISIKIDGISGLKIGQVFKLGDKEVPSPLLPEAYNKVAFLITGLDSSIENNKWYTTVRALTYNLPLNPEKGKSGGKFVSA
mgnify:CR=1 FL=1